MVIQAISIGGAMLVLFAYAGNQLKRMHPETYTYQLLNLIGGAALLFAAITTKQAGLILMEGAWTVISAAGLWRVAARK